MDCNKITVHGFIRSDHFNGCMPCYVFKVGDEGTGSENMYPVGAYDKTVIGYDGYVARFAHCPRQVCECSDDLKKKKWPCC